MSRIKKLGQEEPIEEQDDIESDDEGEEGEEGEEDDDDEDEEGDEIDAVLEITASFDIEMYKEFLDALANQLEEEYEGQGVDDLCASKNLAEKIRKIL